MTALPAPPPADRACIPARIGVESQPAGYLVVFVGEVPAGRDDRPAELARFPVQATEWDLAADVVIRGETRFRGDEMTPPQAPGTPVIVGLYRADGRRHRAHYTRLGPALAAVRT